MTNNEMTKGWLLYYVTNLKLLIFPIYFLNMDIYVVNALIGLTISIPIAETSLEGRVSQ